MSDRVTPLTGAIVDFIAIKQVQDPGITPAQLENEIEAKFGIKPNRRQVTLAIRKVESRVKELQDNPVEAMRLAESVGLFKLHSMLNRVLFLERLAESALNSQHESAAVTAIKYLSELVDSKAKAEVTPIYNIVLGSSDPEPQPYEEGDEDL